MDLRSRSTELNSSFDLSPLPVSSPDNSSFYSVSGLSTPVANLSGSGPHAFGSPSHPPIPPPVSYRSWPPTTSRSSPFLVSRMRNTSVDVIQQITSAMDVQDPATMTDLPALSGPRRPDIASNIDFDEQGAGRLGGHGFVADVSLGLSTVIISPY
uniref:N/A n=1 Tax=Ganoderma boninense TaxID=34458 RepID=A0A5K1K7L6_9APHY|nr:N/A [Ganoderma boninense]